MVDAALAALRDQPDGMRWADMHRAVMQSDPSFNANTVGGSLYDLDRQLPAVVYKPSRGLFRLVEFRDQNTDGLRPELISSPPPQIREEDFYEAFADYLVNDLEECTKAIALGGNKFKDRWGTPDVIGKRESRASDILKAPTEIVTAEIKIVDSALVTAFGQACAYKLFSHKSYVVVPESSPADEITRLDALCQVFGIGLILFNASSPKNPNFKIRARAIRHEPEMFYANKNLRMIERELF
jgi:hypothetical protein